MSKYLYGASVQGIQSFIFQTNKLRDIVGASELVREVCEDMFSDFCEKKCKPQSHDVIVQAAGNIKCVFDDKDDCSKVVLDFPRQVLKAAPGITISQAVVPFEEGSNDAFGIAIMELEKLLKAQRNRPVSSLTTGLMAIERSRATGLPAIGVEKGDYLDEAAQAKRDKETTKKLCEISFGREVNEREIAYDIEKMTERNDWIAVIHADGNGLGKVVQDIGHDREKFKKFSKQLDEATKKAAKATYSQVNKMFEKCDCIPLRPVVLSGDDMTIICRADIAIPYTQAFLENFEKETANLEYCRANNSSLTACAGIAFIKSSFPFYYGYNLAEELCSAAKSAANRETSCLMFHKVQSSFVEDYGEIKKKELTTCDGGSFAFGPYFIKEKNGFWTIENLMSEVSKLSKDSKEGNAVKSSMRKWASLMHKDVGQAAQLKLRAKYIIGEKSNLGKLFEDATKPTERANVHYYPVYDLLTLVAINNQKTK